MFFGRNDAKAEIPVLWPPHAKIWLIGKDSDAGRDWGQEEKGTTEDEMAGWHHWLDGRESGWTPGVGDRQRGLACSNSWGHKESDTTERPNWTELMVVLFLIFWRNFILSSILTASLHPHQQCTRVLFSPNTHPHVFFLSLLDNSHCNRCEVVSHCAFDSYIANK